MDLYAENILDHYRHPRQKKSLDKIDVSHTEENSSCGDVITIEMLIVDDCIAAIGWSGEGCAISQAAMSLLAEKVQNVSIKQAKTLQAKDVLDLLGVPIGMRRRKCALLSLHTLKNALRKRAKEPLEGWLPILVENNGDSSS